MTSVFTTGPRCGCVRNGTKKCSVQQRREFAEEILTCKSAKFDLIGEHKKPATKSDVVDITTGPKCGCIIADTTKPCSKKQRATMLPAITECKLLKKKPTITKMKVGEEKYAKSKPTKNKKSQSLAAAFAVGKNKDTEFFRTAPECSHYITYARLEECFTRIAVPYLKKHSDKWNDDETNLFSIVDLIINDIFICITTNKSRGCKVSEDNIVDELEDSVLHDVIDYIALLRSEYYENEAAKTTTAADARAYIISRSEKLPTVNLVRVRLGDAEAEIYQANLHDIENTEIPEFQIEPDFKTGKYENLMNMNTMTAKLHIIQLMANGDMDEVIREMVHDTLDKKKKNKKKNNK